MLIPTKEGDLEIPTDWIEIWNQAYYDVPRTLEDIRIWCYDNPNRQKTKRGLRAFLGRWIRKSCTKRPQETKAREYVLEPENKHLPLESRQNYLSQLKAMVSK